MSKKPAFPNLGPSSTWGKFDPANDVDARTDRERKLAVQHVLKRLTRPNGDQSMVLMGMVMATTQLAISMKPDAGDEQREFLIELLNFAWVASQAQLAGVERQ